MYEYILTEKIYREKGIEHCSNHVLNLYLKCNNL